MDIGTRLAVTLMVVVGMMTVSMPVHAASDIEFGLASPSIGDLRRAEQRLGFPASLVSLYADFAQPFPRANVDAVHDGGAAALISWEPWDWMAGGSLDQPEFSMASIAAGAHDDAISAWLGDAQQATERGRVIVRFAPEMNGGWNPWSPGVNGTTPGDVVAAWRHVHDVAQAIGAASVEWMWNPNVILAGTTPLWRLYPGDAYVDLIGLDGFNWGTSRPGTRWQSFRELFEPTVRRLRILAPSKPWGVAETASTPMGGNKALWTTNALQQAQRLGADFFVWFDVDKETDWRITSEDRLLQIVRSALR